MFDDDFSFLTGKQADLDNDGKVSFGEYMNDCDDFNRIYRNKNHSTGRYKPQQQQAEGKPIGMVGWILILICCFTPIFSSVVNADGEYMGVCVILTIIFLISWVICFCNRKK